MNPTRSASRELDLVEDEIREVVPLTYQHDEILPPDWTAARPPYRPDSAAEKIWSDVMVWPRRIVLAGLWLTYHWWRAALAMATVFLIWLVLHR
jgi:hypothetical protein